MNASRSREGRAAKRTSNVEWEKMRDRDSGKPEIELRGAAAADLVFDVGRFMSDVHQPWAVAAKPMPGS